MSDAYYNEIDPFASKWVEELAAAGHVAAGRIDRRSIREISANDIGGGQAHFFAGIGGWSRALRLAGVSDDFPIWTGSCPCQPFSVAGRGAGVEDERHLWPRWFELIQERRPAIVFGEQVAKRDGLGWFDAVRTDLEKCGYAVAAADLCAAGVGAPHLRQRLYFVAYADRERLDGLGLQLQQRRPLEGSAQAARRGEAGALGHAGRDGDRQHAGELPHDEGQEGPQRHYPPVDAGATRGFWANANWLYCTDGKWRPAEPGTHPLAHGVPGRVGRLRGYGNAIVPELAATFVRAALGAILET